MAGCSHPPVHPSHLQEKAEARTTIARFSCPELPPPSLYGLRSTVWCWQHSCRRVLGPRAAPPRPRHTAHCICTRAHTAVMIRSVKDRCKMSTGWLRRRVCRLLRCLRLRRRWQWLPLIESCLHLCAPCFKEVSDVENRVSCASADCRIDGLLHSIFYVELCQILLHILRGPLGWHAARHAPAPVETSALSSSLAWPARSTLLGPSASPSRSYCSSK